MKKKIAVYANGWSNEALSQAINGIKKYAAQEDFDVFVFLSFANISAYSNLMQGELNVYKLCNVQDYDGAIVFSNMINSEETTVAILENAKKKGVPVVSIGMKYPGVSSVCVDGHSGMRDLVTHIVEKHGVKRIAYIGGAPGHAESDARMEVTRKVLEEHGLTLDPEDVCYGGWSNRRTIDSMHGILEKRGMPDAFVCANDIMALSAATELMLMGYELPRDVIVTGFDHVREGQIFYPALTSVKQNYDEVGYRCCEMIFQQIREGAGIGEDLVTADMVVGESCGCQFIQELHEVRKDYCRRFYQKIMDTAFMEQTERNMRRKISEVNSYAELKTSLRNHFLNNHKSEGENLHVILNAEYYGDPLLSEEELGKKKSRKKPEVIVSLKDGKVQEIEKLDRDQLIPGYEKKENEQHVYYFLPLHYYQYNYGYVIFADEPYVMREDLLYSYMEKLQQALKLLRINLRLDALNKNLTRLYDKDPMTDLFNRFGYENKAIPLYQESVRKREPMMVMFVDINFMKRINDEYGHIHGDAAIRTVADAIKSNIREDWIAVRFGGDEFLIIAPDCDEEAAEEVKRNILEFMEKKNHDGSRPYQISASCGYVITEPESGYPLQEYIREADRLMYEIKREVHAMDEIARARAAQERGRHGKTGK